MATRETAAGGKGKIPQPAWDKTIKQTYHGRIDADAVQDACLAAIAKEDGRLERKLFAEIMRHQIHMGGCPPIPDGVGVKAGAEKDPTAKGLVKTPFCHREHITARHFNSLWNAVFSAIDSVIEKREHDIGELQARIQRAEKVIGKIEQRVAKAKEDQDATAARKGESALVGKRQRLAKLVVRLAALKAERDAGRVPLCFGSRKLFRAQFHLAESGFASHADWKAAWQKARGSEIYRMGSKDEPAGNHECQVRDAGDGKISVRLRVPEAQRAEHGEFVDLTDIRIPYGYEAVVAALEECQARKRVERAQGKKAASERGVAVTVRFNRDERGWRVAVTVDLARPKAVTDKRLGVVGADLNADHIAVCETDRFGNPIRWFAIPLVTYGLSHEQAEAAISAVVIELVAVARLAGKPLVIEHLEFKDKKAKLEEMGARYARMLSSFAYGRFCSMLTARAFKQGVALHKVRPEFTSVIGRVNYMERYGMTVHQAAALVIGRRFLHLLEKPLRLSGPVPDGRNGHVELGAPARKPKKQQPKNKPSTTRTVWGGLSRRLTAALAARRREEREALRQDRERRRSERPRPRDARGRGEHPSILSPTVPGAVGPG